MTEPTGTNQTRDSLTHSLPCDWLTLPRRESSSPFWIPQYCIIYVLSTYSRLLFCVKFPRCVAVFVLYSPSLRFFFNSTGLLLSSCIIIIIFWLVLLVLFERYSSYATEEQQHTHIVSLGRLFIVLKLLWYYSQQVMVTHHNNKTSGDIALLNLTLHITHDMTICIDRGEWGLGSGIKHAPAPLPS